MKSGRSSPLSLYNALNHLVYEDVSALEQNTLQDVVYIKMHNDMSFLIDGNLNLYKQQSTYNPNMPLQEFLYFARLYEKYVVGNKLNMYGRTLLKISTPKYVVLYNGAEVVGMLLTEFDEEVFVRSIREEGVEEERKEGYREGRAEGRAEKMIEMGEGYGFSEDDILARLQKKLDVSAQKAQEYLGMFRGRGI